MDTGFQNGYLNLVDPLDYFILFYHIFNIEHNKQDSNIDYSMIPEI